MAHLVIVGIGSGIVIGILGAIAALALKGD